MRSGGVDEDAARSDVEAAIGLEIHARLDTRTKLFCRDFAEYGLPPNSAVCPVCLGLPGALPLTNETAVRLAVRAALGLHCTVHGHSAFARKHYFYPDMPKGYQITQHEQPLGTGGHLTITTSEGTPRRIRIRGVHLEEDSGKSLHEAVSGATAIDLNRAGVPLVEVVTEADLRTPTEARAFLDLLKQVLRYLRVAECLMEEGGLRVDANVSVSPPEAGRLGTKTEVKNLNSFRGVERALAFEIDRQSSLLRTGRRVAPETLAWNEGAGETRPIRSKEGAPDYRYLPEPDLPPLRLPEEWLEAARCELPELPWQRRARYSEQYRLPDSHAGVLTSDPDLGDYFEGVVRRGVEARPAAAWVMGEVLSELSASGLTIERFPVRPAGLVALIELVREGAVSRPSARDVLRRMAESGRSAVEVVADEGYAAASGSDLERWVEAVIDDHAPEVARYRGGESRLLDFFMGRVMRLAAGRADPAAVRNLLLDRL